MIWLEVNDKYGILSRLDGEELQNGCILVKIHPQTSYTCEYYSNNDDTIMDFYDEEFSWQTALVQLKTNEINLTDYVRFDRIMDTEFGPSSFCYVFMPLTLLKESK